MPVSQCNRLLLSLKTKRGLFQHPSTIWYSGIQLKIIVEVMSDAPIKILILGASGYLGGTVLHKLLESPLSKSDKLHITITGRKDSSLNSVKDHLASTLKDAVAKHDFEYVKVSHDETSKIETLASEHDVVLNPADSDDLPLTKAINAGLKQRSQVHKSVKRGKPIHTHVSGTALLIDGAGGKHATKKVYDDANAEEIWGFPETALHHKEDLEILRASEQDGIDTLWISPPLIHGIGLGHKKITRQGPTLMEAAVKRRAPGVVGPGLAQWSYVHIEDISKAIVLLTEGAILGKVDVGREGVYFATNTEGKSSPAAGNLKGVIEWRDYAAKIAQAIDNLKPGLLQSLDPTPFSADEEDEYLGKPDGADNFGGNSLSVGNRTKKFGWTPTVGLPDVWETLEEEVRHVLRGMDSSD